MLHVQGSVVTSGDRCEWNFKCWRHEQGDDGAGAMETDVEDDADTVADTKDARDASSPDGAAAARIA